jgi:hypothetical protein
LELGADSLAQTTVDPATGQRAVTMPHAWVMQAIELYGTAVAPAVRKAQQ